MSRLSCNKLHKQDITNRSFSIRSIAKTRAGITLCQKNIFIIFLFFLSTTIFSCTQYFNYNDASKFASVSAGQSKDIVLEHLGEPESKGSFKVAEGIAEIWIYYHDYLTPCSSECERYFYAPIVYLIIENDRVSSVFLVGSEE